MKETYRKMNERIAPEPGLLERMVLQAKKEQRRRAGTQSLWRTVAAAVALVLCVGLSLPALAGSIPRIYELLYALSPATAQYFKGVEMYSEDQGIRMEVLSARIDGETVQVYLSLQDMSGEDRLDETTDLFDSYQIRTPFDCAATCSAAGYDQETGVVTYLITLWQKGEEIRGDKITFGFSKLLTGKKEILIKLPALQEISDTQQSWAISMPEGRRRGGSLSDASNVEESVYWLDSVKILAPVEEMIPLTDGVWLGAVGESDGRLHVQIYYENIHETDNHGGVWFQDKEGKQIQCVGNISFWDDNYRGSFEEYVFDQTAEEMMDNILYGEFTTSNTLITGEWEVTFPVDGK